MEIRIAGEDRGHLEVLRRIAGRRLEAAIPWLGDIEIAWTFEKLTDAPSRIDARATGFGRAGFFDGEPGAIDARLIRDQLFLWTVDKATFDAAVIGRDADRVRDSTGARQALRASPPRMPVAVAYAAPEIEAWVVAGFSPRDEREAGRLRECCTSVSFDPCKQPERLTSTTRGHARDAKRVCATLLPDADDRYDRCLDVDEGEWRRRTTLAGGAAFLDELDLHLVPVLRRPQG